MSSLHSNLRRFTAEQRDSRSLCSAVNTAERKLVSLHSVKKAVSVNSIKKKGKLTMSQPCITDPNRASRLMGVLNNNVDFGQVPDTTVDWVLHNPVEAGQQFTAFLKKGARVIVGEPKVITIDRSTPFNPEFVGQRWKIDTDEQEDTRSLGLTQLDLTAIRFKTMLKDGESFIDGEEKIKRLKTSKNIRLDVKIFQTLWENKHLIPERWKEKTNGNTTYIYFDGTILLNPDGDRYVLCLCWDGGEWDWDYIWLDNAWFANDPSAVLES